MRHQLLRVAYWAELTFEGIFAAIVIPPLVAWICVAGLSRLAGVSPLEAALEGVVFLVASAHWFVGGALFVWLDYRAARVSRDGYWRAVAVGCLFGALGGWAALSERAGVLAWDLVMGAGAGALLGAVAAASGTAYANQSGRRIRELASRLAIKQAQ